MDNKHYLALELDKVLELLAAKTTSEASAQKARSLIPLGAFDDAVQPLPDGELGLSDLPPDGGQLRRGGILKLPYSV